MKKLVLLTLLHELVQALHYLALFPIWDDLWPSRIERGIVLSLVVLAPVLYYLVHKYKETSFRKGIFLTLTAINWIAVVIILALSIKKPWIFINTPGDPHGDFSIAATWINPAIYYFFNLFFFLLPAFLILYQKRGKWDYRLLLNVIPLIIWILVMIALSHTEHPQFEG